MVFCVDNKEFCCSNDLSGRLEALKPIDQWLGLSSGYVTRPNRSDLPDPKPNGWVQIAWLVGFGSYAIKNRKFGSGVRLSNLKPVETDPTANTLKKELGLFSRSKSRPDLSLSLSKLRLFIYLFIYFFTLSLSLSLSL